jgi:hypothetical protein
MKKREKLSTISPYDFDGSLDNAIKQLKDLRSAYKKDYQNLVVELEDEWETFLLKFSVMNPLENPHDELYLSSEILGDKLVKLEKVKVP